MKVHLLTAVYITTILFLSSCTPKIDDSKYVIVNYYRESNDKSIIKMACGNDTLALLHCDNCQEFEYSNPKPCEKCIKFRAYSIYVRYSLISSEGYINYRVTYEDLNKVINYDCSLIDSINYTGWSKTVNYKNIESLPEILEMQAQNDCHLKVKKNVGIYELKIGDKVYRRIEQ